MIDLHANAIRARIGRWRDSGLIDGETADRLLLHESEARPLFGSTLTLIGALSIGLGIVAVVSANWEDIPVRFRLAAHLAVNVGLGLWGAWIAREEKAGWLAADAPLIILSASTLAFIAHVGQAFQLQGDPFTPLAVWLVLTAPFLLTLGRSAATRWAWTGMLGMTLSAFLKVHFEKLFDAHALSALGSALVVAAFASPLIARGPRGEPWGRHFQNLAVVAVVAGVSLAQLGWRLDLQGEDLSSLRSEALYALLVAVPGFALSSYFLTGLPFWRRPISAFVVLSPVYAAVPLLAGGADSAVAEAGAVCFYWLGVALLAHGAGRFQLYKLAVVVVTLRLFGVFLEAFGGLLMTGGGLIAAGALFLALGFGVKRLLQRTAAP